MSTSPLIDEKLFQWRVTNAGCPLVSGSVPDVKSNVIASILDIVKFLNQQLQAGNRFLYLKGVVASGKTTTLRIIEAATTNCLYVTCGEFVDNKNAASFDARLLEKILNKWSIPVQLPKARNRSDVRHALEEVLTKHIPANAILFIDEAHIAFQLRTTLLERIKSGIKCAVIFTTTTNPVVPKAGTELQSTPQDLLSTFIPQWHLTEEYLRDFVQAVWGRFCPDLDKFKDDASSLTKFLICVTGGHRGFCAELLTVLSAATNDLRSVIGAMNDLVCVGLKCRYVRANGAFDSLTTNTATHSALQDLMRFGSVKYESTNKILRMMITIGALTPPNTRLSESVELRIPNPFYAESVRKNSNLPKVNVAPPKSVCDFLVYGIAYFDVRCLFNTAQGTTPFWTRVPAMPYELQIDEGIAHGIENATGIKVTTGFGSSKGASEGKPDVVIPVVGHVIEYVLNGNKVQDHFDRFDAFPAYHQDRGEQLLVIFVRRDTEPTLPTKRTKKTAKSPAKIATITFEQDTFWIMRVAFYEAAEAALAVADPRGSTHSLVWKGYPGPAIPVDFVARHVVFRPAESKFEFEPAQELSAAKRPREEQQAKRIQVWVQQWVSDNHFGQPFKVTPAGNDVDDLKDAIKAKRQVLCATVDAADITILNPGTTTVANPGQPWGTSTAGEPYLFELPKPQS